MLRRAPLPALMLLPALVLGCGGEPRGDVEGTVTYDGQPVETGMVSFECADATRAPRNIPVRNGSYEASGPSALAPGTYRVGISAGDPAAMDRGAPGDQHTRVEYVPLLPPSWNTQSELSVDVRPGSNTFHFRGDRGEAPRVEVP